MVNLMINGKTVQVEEGTTILDAAKKIDIRIPTLCHNPDLPAWASCGICIVRLAGTARMIRACCTVVTEGMNIITHDPEIVQARRTVLELILSNHPDDCLRCSRNGRCELQALAAEFGLRTVRFKKILKEQPVDDSNDAIVLDRDKCINCGRCVVKWQTAPVSVADSVPYIVPPVQLHPVTPTASCGTGWVIPMWLRLPKLRRQSGLLSVKNSVCSRVNYLPVKYIQHSVELDLITYLIPIFQRISPLWKKQRNLYNG